MDVSWNQLAELRQRGQQPALPVCLAIGKWPGFYQTEFAVIHIDRDETLPLDLLAGLEVWLLTGCREAVRISELAKAQLVKRGFWQCWCYRQKILYGTPGECGC